MKARIAATRSRFRDFAARERRPQHWMERVAAGVLPAPALMGDEAAKIEVLRKAIHALRAKRAAARAISSPPVIRAIIRWRGVPVTKIGSRDACPGYRVMYRCTLDPNAPLYHTAREAVAAALAMRVWRYGKYELDRRIRHWRLRFINAPQKIDILEVRAVRPTRDQIARAIRSHRAASTSISAPDTLGWRAWCLQDGRLVSPHQHTVWDAHDLRAEMWSDDHALRGEAGIHARRMPRNWMSAGWPYRGSQEGLPGGVIITGVVERFGRYILGTEGWRAEWVVIRELMAPDVSSMLALMQAYPEVRVHLKGVA